MELLEAKGRDGASSAWELARMRKRVPGLVAAPQGPHPTVPGPTLLNPALHCFQARHSGFDHGHGGNHTSHSDIILDPTSLTHFYP